MDQRMKYSYAAVCATGRVRTENQDRIYLNGTICSGGYAQTDGTGRKQGLFAVADGMGGQAQGAQAAQAALEALPPKKCWSPGAVLQAYDAGNRAICDQIGKIGKRSGATLTTLLLADGEAYAANIGDSRCYLYRDGCLSRLSEDHTAVQRLIALGIIEPAEAKTHPERHRLTQHLGIFPDELIIQPHTVQLPVRPGDRFLLCSDGLTDMLEEEDLSALLRSQTAAPACAAALYTRYYMDEMHLLLKEEQTAVYSVEIWKRFRKWGGIPTGLTQNVKDLLSSREVENIFENSDMIIMLNQAAGDRQILAKQLNISPHQLSYVTHSGEGEGLLFFGNVILPFVDRFPTDLELYRIMTTKLGEVSEGAQK